MLSQRLQTCKTLRNNGTAKGDGRVKFHPDPSDPGDPFPIPTIKHCKLSLSKLGENKQFTSFGEFILGMQVPIGGLKVPIYPFTPVTRALLRRCWESVGHCSTVLKYLATVTSEIKHYNLPERHIVKIRYIYILLVEMFAW